MSDPTIEAAQRAMHGWQTPLVKGTAIDAAREALKPLRSRHRKVRTLNGDVCHHCWNSMGYYMQWPCPDALDIYSTEELEAMK